MSAAIPDRNLALELVRVTESAATFASRWIGRGDKIAADQAAVDAMRLMLDTVEHARGRRDRRGGEGRGADALQRRGDRGRYGPGGGRRRRPSRGNPAHGPRHAERDLGDRRRPSAGRCSFQERRCTWTRSPSARRRQTRSTSTPLRPRTSSGSRRRSTSTSTTSPWSCWSAIATTTSSPSCATPAHG